MYPKKLAPLLSSLPAIIYKFLKSKKGESQSTPEYFISQFSGRAQILSLSKMGDE